MMYGSGTSAGGSGDNETLLERALQRGGPVYLSVSLSKNNIRTTSNNLDAGRVINEKTRTTGMMTSSTPSVVFQHTSPLTYFSGRYLP
jgi:hypothetical protein